MTSEPNESVLWGSNPRAPRHLSWPRNASAPAVER